MNTFDFFSKNFFISFSDLNCAFAEAKTEQSIIKNKFACHSELFKYLSFSFLLFDSMKRYPNIAGKDFLKDIFSRRFVRIRFSNLAFKRAGLKYRATHGLRHGGCNFYYNMTGDLSVAKEVLGNSDMKTVQVYAERNPKAVKSLIKEQEYLWHIVMLEPNGPGHTLIRDISNYDIIDNIKENLNLDSGGPKEAAYNAIGELCSKSPNTIAKVVKNYGIGVSLDTMTLVQPSQYGAISLSHLQQYVKFWLEDAFTK